MFGPSGCAVGSQELQKARGDLEVQYTPSRFYGSLTGAQQLEIPHGRACRCAFPGTPVGTVGRASETSVVQRSARQHVPPGCRGADRVTSGLG